MAGLGRMVDGRKAYQGPAAGQRLSASQHDEIATHVLQINQKKHGCKYDRDQRLYANYLCVGATPQLTKPAKHSGKKWEGDTGTNKSVHTGEQKDGIPQGASRSFAAFLILPSR